MSVQRNGCVDCWRRVGSQPAQNPSNGPAMSADPVPDDRKSRISTRASRMADGGRLTVAACLVLIEQAVAQVRRYRLDDDVALDSMLEDIETYVTCARKVRR